MVPRISPWSSTLISVNITPTTEWFLYHPVTSVSLVDNDNAERMLLSTRPLLSNGKQFPASSSISNMGFRERSVRFRSRVIMLRNETSSRIELSRAFSSPAVVSESFQMLNSVSWSLALFLRLFSVATRAASSIRLVCAATPCCDPGQGSKELVRSASCVVLRAVLMSLLCTRKETLHSEE